MKFCKDIIKEYEYEYENQIDFQLEKINIIHLIHYIIHHPIYLKKDKKKYINYILKEISHDLFIIMNNDDYLKYRDKRINIYCIHNKENKYPCKNSKLMIKKLDHYGKDLIDKIKNKFINLLFINDIYQIRNIFYNNIKIENNNDKDIILFNSSEYKIDKQDFLDRLFQYKSNYLYDSMIYKDEKYIKSKMNDYPKFLDYLFPKLSIVFYIQKKQSDFLLLANTIQKANKKENLFFQESIDVNYIKDILIQRINKKNSNKKKKEKEINEIQKDNYRINITNNNNNFNQIFLGLNLLYKNEDEDEDENNKFEYLLFTNKFNKDKKFQLFTSIDKDTVNDETIIFIFYLNINSSLSNIIIDGDKTYLTYKELRNTKIIEEEYI